LSDQFYLISAEKCSNIDKRKKYLSLSKLYYRESLQIKMKVFGSTHLEIIKAVNNLSLISTALLKA
jgi:hypothetical protein